MIINESFLRDILRLLVWFPLRWITPFLPISFSLKLFKLMGLLNYFFAVKKKKNVRKNMTAQLNHKLTKKEINREVKSYFQMHIINTLFPFIINKITPQFMRKNVEIHGIDYLYSELKKKKGCILVQGHVGPVQFPLLYFNYLGFNVGQVFYRREKKLSWIGKNVQLKFREKTEKRLNARLFPVNAFQRPLFRWLAANNILMINGDGIGGLEFIGPHYEIPFLKNKLLVPLGLYKLKNKTKASLLFTSVLLQKNTFIIKLHPPFPSDYSENDINIVMAKQFGKHLENLVNKHPHTWHFWDAFQKGILIPDDK